MALKILPEVTASGDLKRDGCYIQIQPTIPFVVVNPEAPDTLPVLVNIWADKADFEANPYKPSIRTLVEIRKDNLYYFDPANAGDTYEGKNIVWKMLMWASEAVKAQILIDNPKWTDTDIEIVDIPKI